MNNSSPKKCSILIPTFNSESFIHQALKTSLEQTYPNIEIVCVDNCSTDNTYQILKSYAASYPSKIRVFCNEKNLGRVKNWQRALQLSRGHYIKFHFSDDLLEKECIFECIKAIESDEEHAAVVFNLVFKEGFKMIYSWKRLHNKIKADHFLDLILTEVLPVSPHAYLYKKDSIIDFINFDPLAIKDDHTFIHGAGPDAYISLLGIYKGRSSCALINKILGKLGTTHDSVSCNPLTNIPVKFDYITFYISMLQQWNLYKKASFLFGYKLLAIWKLSPKRKKFRIISYFYQLLDYPSYPMIVKGIFSFITK